MGFYIDRKNYLQQMCEVDPQVRHNQPVSDTDSRPRQSFFEINEEEQLLAASVNWIFFPCVVQFGLSGSDVNKGGSVRQRNVNIWLFLTKIEIDPANPVFDAALSSAYDITYDVMQSFKSNVGDDYEENEGCGVFKYLEPAFAKWEQYGPVGDQLYGWILTFSDETKPRP